jgi:hypothetical protein
MDGEENDVTCLESGKKPPFPGEQMRNLSRFAETLARIHIRLLMEGYTFDEECRIHRPDERSHTRRCGTI